MKTRIPYLQLALQGRAGPYDYIMGAWFLMLAFVLGQLLGAVITLVPLMLEMGDEAENAFSSSEGASKWTTLSLLAGVGSILAFFAGRQLSNRPGLIAKGLALFCVAVAIVAQVKSASASTMGAAESQAVMDLMHDAISGNPVAYAITLAAFGMAWLGAAFVARVVHARPFRTLMTAASRIRWSRIFWTLLLTFGVYAAFALVAEFTTETGVYANPRRPEMWPFLLATLIFIPIQAGAEELIFRGYLNQALGRFIPSALLVFVLTSLAFGALHLGNPEMVNSEPGLEWWAMFMGYVLFGLFLSLMVWIDNGLEAAIGVHTANNMWAATFINYEGSVLPVPGLFIQPQPDGAVWTLISMLTLAVVLLGVWWTRRPLDNPTHLVDTAA